MTELDSSYHRSLRYGMWRVLLFTMLIAVLPLVVLQGVSYLRQFRAQRQTEFRANLEMARAVAVAFRNHLQEVRRDEMGLGNQLSIAALFPPEEENVLLATVAQEHSGVRSLSWISPSGTIISSDSPRLVGRDVSREPWFRVAKATREWVVTDATRTRDPAGRTIVVAQPAHDEDGAFSGVVAATISLQNIGEQMGITRQDNGACALVDGSGWLAYRDRGGEVPWEQRDWGARYPMVAVAQRGQESTGSLVIAPEPQPRVAAATPVPDTHWVAVASRPEVEAIAPIRFAVLREAAGFLVVALLSFLIATWAAQRITVPMARLRQHALEVGGGNLGHRLAPAGPLELAELATAFNRMAEEVQSREQEHVRRLELERARAQDARLLEAVQEHTLTLLAYFDRDLRFRQVNGAYCQALQRPREEIIGRHYEEVSESKDILALLNQVRAAGEPTEVREMRRGATEHPRLEETFWDVSVVPVDDEAGQLEGLVLSAIDVTQQVQAREELLEVERLRAQMAETIATEINHRMKNNLTLLSGILQLQLGAQDPDSVAAQELRQAISRISSLSAVHEQLYAGQGRRVELKATLERIGLMAADALSRNGVEVTVTGEPIYVSSRVGSVLAVVANELVINAIKHGEPAPGGKLQIKADLSREGQQVHLRVWNSGNPVPEGFDPGRQRGLGLRLAQGLTVEQLRGSFRLRREGNGTLGEVVVDENVLFPDSKGS